MFIVTDNNVMVNLDNVDKICINAYKGDCKIDFVKYIRGNTGVCNQTLGSINFKTPEEIRKYVEKKLMPLTRDGLNDISQGLINIECSIRDRT